MAKKGSISKNSRAARRGQVDVFTSSETKELENLPRLENTDTISSLIRSSVNKNQQLLNNKILKSSRHLNKLKPGDNVITNHLNKKKQHMVSKTVRSKQLKFKNIDGRLGKKIEDALRKKKIISNLRKTGWDKINEIAKTSLDNDLVSKMNSEKKTVEDIDNEIIDEMRDEADIHEIIQQQPKNPFGLLTEEE